MTDDTGDITKDGTAEAETVPSPVALVSGRPVADIPRDLYIPPDALAVFLEAFEDLWIFCCT